MLPMGVSVRSQGEIIQEERTNAGRRSRRVLGTLAFAGVAAFVGPGTLPMALGASVNPPPASAELPAEHTSTLQDLGRLVHPTDGPSTIYVAREFITMDPKKPRAEAVAVRDGKFVAVGTRAEVGAAAGKDARLDKTFNDKVVIAGFVEQHVHPVLAALTMNTKVISIEDWDAIDGFSPSVRDEKGYSARLKNALAAHKDRRKPFVTWGYHHYNHPHE